MGRAVTFGFGHSGFSAGDSVFWRALDRPARRFDRFDLFFDQPGSFRERQASRDRSRLYLFHWSRPGHLVSPLAQRNNRSTALDLARRLTGVGSLNQRTNPPDFFLWRHHSCPDLSQRAAYAGPARPRPGSPADARDLQFVGHPLFVRSWSTWSAGGLAILDSSDHFSCL